MKLKEINDLRGKGEKDIRKLLEEKRSEIAKTEVKRKVSKEKNLKRVKMLKRDVSRILTILAEKKFVTEAVNEKGGEGES